MSSANPIPRSARRNDVAAATGQTVFGPFDWKIYDIADVAVLLRGAAETSYTAAAPSGYTVALTGAAPSFFTVTFTTAPRPAADAVSVRIAGARIHARETDVTQGGVVRSASLESELDRQTTMFQELRRDVDDALAPGALDTAIAAAVAAGTAVINALVTATQAALTAATALTENLTETVNGVLAQVNVVLAAATLAKDDAEDAAEQTTADRVQTGADVATTAGLVAAAEGYAAALANPDYGFFTDVPSATRDYGSFL